MSRLLNPDLLISLENEIRRINLMPMISDISRGDVRMVLGSYKSPAEVEELINLKKGELEELLSSTPKLKCWYVPIFSVNKLWQLSEEPIWIETNPRVRYGGAFEFYYWEFFSNILEDFHQLAPFVLGISQEVNYLFTVLRDDGASVDSIVNRAFTGHFNLCLPSLTRLFNKTLPSPSGLSKFIYGTDVTLIRTYR